jgi:hypothetical protein
MSLQNIPLRNFLIENFMNKVPKIHHQEVIDTTSIEVDDFKYQEQTEEVDNDENQYKYLDDDILNQVFMYNNEVNYNLHLSLYQFIDDTTQPFIQYYFIKNNELEFPKAILDKSKFENDNEGEKKEIKVKSEKEPFSLMNFLSFSKDKQQGGDDKTDDKEKEEEEKDEEEEKPEPNDDESNIHSIFKEQIFDFFKNVTKYKGEDSSKMYRGFLQENEDLFIFFDCTNIDLPETYDLDLKDKKGFERLLISDIIENKHYHPINNNITNLFYQNSFLQYIKELDNTNIQIPIRAYICEEKEEKYRNMYYENKVEEITLVNEKIQHEEFDYMYVFSQDPISKDNIENIKSYALFVKKDIPVITETKEDLDLVKENIDDYNVFYFMKEGNKYFGVRNKMFFSEL